MSAVFGGIATIIFATVVRKFSNTSSVSVRDVRLASRHIVRLKPQESSFELKAAPCRFLLEKTKQRVYEKMLERMMQQAK